MNELIKCRGRSCENCGKPINGYAYLVKKAIRVRNPNYKRLFMKPNDEIIIHDDGVLEFPEEVIYSKPKIIEQVWCTDCEIN